MARLIDVIARGTRAAQPAANTLPNGSLYFVTDEDLIEQVQSAAWQLYIDLAAIAGVPGGVDKNIQYNNNSVFGGVANNATATKKFLAQVSSGTPALDQVSGADLVDDSVGPTQLADTAVTPATYGDSTHVAQITVDQQGRLTAAAEVLITGGGGGSREIILATADVTRTNNDTLSDDPDLLKAIGAGEVWRVEFWVSFLTDGSFTPDVKVALSLPSGATARWWTLGPQIDTTNTGNTTMNARSNTLPASPVPIGTSSSSTNAALCCIVAIIDNPSNAGNIALQWAQNTSNGTGTVRGKHSHMICEQLS